jgi:hypothetical protein
MIATNEVRATWLEQFAKVGELLDLVGDFRDLQGELDSPEGFRRAAELTLRLAELLGVDGAWIERLRALLAEESTFRLALALVQFVLHRAGRKAEAGAIRVSLAERDEVHLTAHAFLDWLPLVMEIVNLVRRIQEMK